MRAKEIRREALSKLENNWISMIAITIVVFVLLFALNAVSVLLLPVLLPGKSLFTLKLIRGENPNIGDLFSVYKNYLNALVAYILEFVIISVGLFLFIIPGIIFSYMFAMVPFLIADDNHSNLSAFDILKESARMMKGNKWKFFCLHFSFIGWGLLCILTFGIAAIWVVPYTFTSEALFYTHLKETEMDGMLNSQTDAFTEFEN